MKIRIVYPVVSIEEEIVEVTEKEGEEIIRNMGNHEQADWARNALLVKESNFEMPSWRLPIGLEDMQESFSLGISKLEAL